MSQRVFAPITQFCSEITTMENTDTWTWLCSDKTLFTNTNDIRAGLFCRSEFENPLLDPWSSGYSVGFSMVYLLPLIPLHKLNSSWHSVCGSSIPSLQAVLGCQEHLQCCWLSSALCGIFCHDANQLDFYHSFPSLAQPVFELCLQSEDHEGTIPGTRQRSLGAGWMNVPSWCLATAASRFVWVNSQR